MTILLFIAIYSVCIEILFSKFSVNLISQHSAHSVLLILIHIPKGKYCFASRGDATVDKSIFGNKQELENKLLENDEQEEITFHSDSFWWINFNFKRVLWAGCKRILPRSLRKCLLPARPVKLWYKSIDSTGISVKVKGIGELNNRAHSWIFEASVFSYKKKSHIIAVLFSWNETDPL